MAIVLLDVAIPAAGTYTAAVFSLGELFSGARGSVLLQGKMANGASGTEVDAYVQSTADNGVTWYDVVCFKFNTGNKTRLVNLRTSTAVATLATPTDGALTVDTSVDGLVGDVLRVKYVVTGNYSAGQVTVTAVPR